MTIKERISELCYKYEVENNRKLTEEEKKLISYGFKQAVLDMAWKEVVGQQNVK